MFPLELHVHPQAFPINVMIARQQEAQRAAWEAHRDRVDSGLARNTMPIRAARRGGTFISNLADQR
jgi:hypothetical protein